jgi:hypothetical protein
MPWTDLSAPTNLKYLKELGGILLAPDDTPIVIKWWTDFKSSVNSQSMTMTGGAFAEYNADALYTSAEYSGDVTVVDLRAPVQSGSEFKYISMGIEADISGFPFALQSATLVARIGRNA